MRTRHKLIIIIIIGLIVSLLMTRTQWVKHLQPSVKPAQQQKKADKINQQYASKQKRSSTERLKQLREQIAAEQAIVKNPTGEFQEEPLLLFTYKKQGQWQGMLQYDGELFEVGAGFKLPDGNQVVQVEGDFVVLQDSEGEVNTVHFVDKYGENLQFDRTEQITGILEVTAPQAAKRLQLSS